MENFRYYIVRPLPKPARVDLKFFFKVILPASAIIFQDLRAGDICHIKTLEGKLGPVMVWPSSEKIQDTVIQIPKALQILYGLKLGDKVSLLQNEGTVVGDARFIKLLEVAQPGRTVALQSLTEADSSHWAWFLEYVLEKAEVLCPGMILDGVELKEERRCFKVIEINSSSNLLLYHVNPRPQIQLLVDGFKNKISNGYSSNSLILSGEDIGGLDKQLKKLNDRLTAYREERSIFRYPPYYRPIRGGIILHGASGTGKSMMLKKLSTVGWRKVYEIGTSTETNPNKDRKAVIQDIFSEARRHQPCLIVIDGIERIARKREAHNLDTSYNLAPTLCEELDRLGAARILVLVTTLDLSKIDESLRGLGRLEFEIEMPVPDRRARAEILKIRSGIAKDTKHTLLENLADRTHGFVGADLDRLLQLAVEKGRARMEAMHSKETPRDTNWASQPKAEIKVEVSETDLDEALVEVRPTAMREIFLETPKVRWCDIGGQHEVKNMLEQAIKWPFKYSSDMVRLGIEPKRGLLLYGPPGCSKTLTAKAVATESGLNFIAVKGGELLNMYVGESERALREVFRKARAARPSILFFDEIDAIGGSREGNIQSGELNVLTTMLNELDGIESLNGVFVLAATNKPQILDPALMRPGRLDTALYIGLPDCESRREILQIRLHLMDVEEDVDIADLANRADGYSGAELVSVCQKAGYAALEEQVSSGLQQKVGKRHFEIALLEVPRQITLEMTERYKFFEAKAS